MKSWQAQTPLHSSSSSSSHSHSHCYDPAPGRHAPASNHHTSSRQQPARSASEQLQSYIDSFERAQVSTPVSKAVDDLVPRQLGANNDTDAWNLLCGRGVSGRSHVGDHVSVKTRCILRDVDRRMGHLVPCYSSPENLDLRSLWPSMHEHLERRWRQQLRDRYEARQHAETATKATATAASAGASNRADMYRYSRTSTGGRRIRLPMPPPPRPETTGPGRDVETLEDSDNDDDAEESSSESGGFSLVEAAAAAARSSEERLWGSDSGLGLSCNGAPATAVPATTIPVAAAGATGGNDAAEDPDADDGVGGIGGGSFEDRMRSYRCVLEAHELSSSLRQHLEVACATIGSGGKRVLSVEDKGRIRDRLARLQGPMRGGFVPPDEAEQQLLEQQKQHDQDIERITTERLSRLMSSARRLLTNAEVDRGWLGRLSTQQEEQQVQREPRQVASATDFEAGQDPDQC